MLSVPFDRNMRVISAPEMKIVVIPYPVTAVRENYPVEVPWFSLFRVYQKITKLKPGWIVFELEALDSAVMVCMLSLCLHRPLHGSITCTETPRYIADASRRVDSE